MKQVLRDISIVVLVTVVMMIAASVRGETASAAIRIRAQATITGEVIQLRHVATLAEADDALGDLAVARFPTSAPQVVVTADDVRRALAGAHVHWGHVTVGGFRQCVVTRAPTEAPQESPATGPADVGAALANPESPMDAAAPVMLRDLLLEKLANHAGIDRTSLEVSFSGVDDAQLGAPIVGQRWEVQPAASGGLGRVALTVRRFEGDRVAASFRINADVAWRTLAVVASRALSRGQTITDADVEVREVTLHEARSQNPVNALDTVLGQVSDAILREGTIIYPSHLRAPVLVKRGQLVTVRAMVGDLVVRTAGRATEDGRDGCIIQVRNERSRQIFAARVAGVQEVVVDAGTSAPSADSPAASAAARQEEVR